jgi:Leucine-rich repeat (LRR) protein
LRVPKPINVPNIKYDPEPIWDLSELPFEYPKEDKPLTDFSKLEVVFPKKIDIIQEIKACEPVPCVNYINLFRKCNNCEDYNVYMVDKHNNDIYFNDTNLLLGQQRKDIIFLKINKQLKGIEREAFENSSNLEEMDLSCESIEVIKEKAFNYCLNLSKVKLGSNLIMLEDYCFANTTHLDHIYISDSNNLKSIGKYCFYGSQVKIIDLPDNIEIIGNSCFENSSLEYIKYPTIIYCDIVPQRCFKNAKLKSIYIPNNVKIIRGEAFMNNRDLKTIIVSKNIEIIEKGSFRNLHEDCEIILLKNENKKRKKGCYIYIDLGAFDIPTKEIEKYVEKYINSSNIIIRKSGLSVQMDI